MRRRLALLTLAATLVAVPAVAAERVSVKPRHGDVNTRFVFRGSGWRPNAKLEYTHGAFCAASAVCPAIAIVRPFESDANGRFKVSERAGPYVPFDFVGADFCFSYRGPDAQPGCRATIPIGLTPPSAAVTPVDPERSAELPDPVTMTLAAEHFKAGSRLTVHIRSPDGRRRTLKTRARRRGAHVGPANAWAPRGGAIRLFTLRPADPDGTYRVRVVGKLGGEARTFFVAQHYHD